MVKLTAGVSNGTKIDHFGPKIDFSYKVRYICKQYHLEEFLFTLAHPQHNLVVNWFPLWILLLWYNHFSLTKAVFIISEIPFEIGKWSNMTNINVISCIQGNFWPSTKNGWSIFLTNGACQSCNLSDNYHIFPLGNFCWNAKSFKRTHIFLYASDDIL